MLIDAIGHQKLRLLGPSVSALYKLYLILTQRLAMRLGRVLLVRGSVADVAVQDDQSGPTLRRLEGLNSLMDAGRIVGIAHP